MDNIPLARRVLGYADNHPNAIVCVYTTPENRIELLRAILSEEPGRRAGLLSDRIKVVAYRSPEERTRAAQAYEPKKRAEG